MTFTSVAQANSKTAEFARLFDLFDRVATRRSRALIGGTASEIISADDIANVPAEFAPVLQNLSTILSLRARHDEEHARRAQAVSTNKPRYNLHTPASAPTTADIQTLRTDVKESLDAVEEDTENPRFPPGQRYPFTFKLMLHKLYDLDEWAEKVKNAVEMSKSQFKPLAERVQNVARGTGATSVKECGEKRSRSSGWLVLGASAKFKPLSTTRHAAVAAMHRDATGTAKERGEKRNSTRPVLSASARFRPSSTTKHYSAAAPAKPEATRVLKKRCIGRRKSISNPMSTGVWVYDAAISAIEIAGPRPSVEITLSAPRGHGAGGGVESRARHRSLTALEEMHARDAARRKVKITVPLLQEEDAKSVLPQLSSVSFAGPAQEMESVVRRRSMASVFASQPCKRAAVKRPLCV